MGRVKDKRPRTLPNSTGVDAERGGIANFQAYSFNGAAMLASASSAATSIGWGKIVSLSAFSSAGGPTPLVVNMAAATSGDVCYLVGNAVAASSNGIAVRLQAATSAKTFDGANDQLLFSYPYQSAFLVALSSARVLALCTSLMLTASTS